MKNLILSFKDYLKQHDKSDQTIQSYATSVERYMQWYLDKFGDDPSRLHGENILQFRDELGQEPNAKKVQTINLYLHALKSFNHFLVDSGVMEDVVIKSTFYKKQQESLTPLVKFDKQEIERFLQTILDNNSKAPGLVYRDYALAKTMALAGLRISEVLSLTTKDIHLDAKEIVVRDSKHNKTRTTLVNKELKYTLNHYLNDIRPHFVRDDETDIVFLNREGGAMSRKTVYKDFKNYSQKAGLPEPLTAHDLRHHFCSQCAQVGLAAHEIAALAGHSNINTTFKYIHASRKEMENKLDEL